MGLYFCKEHNSYGMVPCSECPLPPDTPPPEWFKKLFTEAYVKAVEQSNKGAGKLARKTRKKNKKRRK